MEQAGLDISLPDCSTPFLISYLLELGPVVSAGLGLAPIGWRDIEAWQACTATRLPPWQARMLVELSREYVSFSREAEKPDCLSPISDEAQTENRREAVERSLRIGFRAMMMKKGR